jgi:exopolysaccharide biosynthesis polyprenyl glycosylphosphotransferase
MDNRNRKDFLIPLLLVLSDSVAIEASFLASYWLRFFSPLTAYAEVTKGIPGIGAYIESSLIVIPVWIWLFNARGMYASRRILYFSDEFFAVVRIVFLGMLVVMAGAFFYRGFSFSRLVFVLLGGTSILFLSTGRLVMMRFEQWWYARGKDLKNVVIVGTTSTAIQLSASVAHHPALGYRLVGYFATDPSGSLGTDGIPYLGTIDDVAAHARTQNIDLILIALEEKDHPRLLNLVKSCEGLNAEMMMVPDILELMTAQVRLKILEGIPFIPIKSLPMSTWNVILKRTFDLTVSLVLLVILSPILLLLAILIKLGSKGPVLYSQERLGLDGSRFSVLKFRSMHVDAEKTSGPVWASEDDPRRTQVGTFLRRWSLDELPQLWNVVTGEMSLVGPRPERPHFVEQFKREIPKYLERHRVKAGMTGWAQVNGLRGNASVEERTKYDVFYVENWSLVFDLKIIFKTIRAVLFGNDAY